MTVPGVSVITTSAFIAAIGDIRRFASAKQGSAAFATSSSKRMGGDPTARPAFYERVRARRGAQVAAVATARNAKMAGLFWCLPIRGQDYAFAQPSLTARKIRARELATGAPSRQGPGPAGDGARTAAIRHAEHALALQAEQAYRRTISDWNAAAPTKVGASVTPGRASQRPSKGKAARQTTSP
jgi:hypothetical protein